MTRTADSDLAAFEAQRASLLALAYRMLGDMGRAEELVQDAWLRWAAREGEAVSPRAYLAALVTRLCLNELGSARRRKEEARGDRLPEPVALERGGIERLESLELVSMAFLVALQRLTPAERAVLLLHDVFDFEHAEISALVGKSPAACRKLLERAKSSLAEEERMFAVSREAHARLLASFVRAVQAGDTAALASILAADAVVVTDGGTAGRVVGSTRSLPEPLRGADAVADFVVGAAKQGRGRAQAEIRDLNGQPALVLRGAHGTFAAITLACDQDRIRAIYIHGDLSRLGHIDAGDRQPGPARA